MVTKEELAKALEDAELSDETLHVQMKAYTLICSARDKMVGEAQEKGMPVSVALIEHDKMTRNDQERFFAEAIRNEEAWRKYFSLASEYDGQSFNQ